jgi:hypothetical protein
LSTAANLDLDLAAELVLYASFGQLCLENDLECYDVVGALLARKIHIAKLPAAKRLADIKVRQLPAPL